MLAETNCHFRWKMEHYSEHSITRVTLVQFEKEHKKFAEEYPKAKIAVNLLLSYLHATSERPNLEEAKRYVEEILQLKSIGEWEKVVAIGNKMHILHKIGTHGEKD